MVTHRRPGPVRHGFRHRAYQWLVDLDAVPRQPWYLRPFADFSSADHLGDPSLPLKANVENYLAGNGISLGSGGRVIMLANARVLGYVFDPLSVFWCYDGAGTLACVVAEVHNTYGERHAYLLHPDEEGKSEAGKELYVSPFFDVSGVYGLSFTLTRDLVSATVILRKAGAVAFSATFRGRPQPATRRGIARRLLREPLMPQRVSALIRAHGIWLWIRRLPVAARPHHVRQEGVLFHDRPIVHRALDAVARDRHHAAGAAECDHRPAALRARAPAGSRPRALPRRTGARRGLGRGTGV